MDRLEILQESHKMGFFKSLGRILEGSLSDPIRIEAFEMITAGIGSLRDGSAKNPAGISQNGILQESWMDP